MKQEDVLELARDLVETIGIDFGLNEWEITLEVQGSHDDGYLGVVQAFEEYEKAHIVLFADNIDDLESLVDTLVHEMIHVLVSPVFRLAEVTGSLEGLLNYAAEKTVLKLERAMRRLGYHEKLLKFLSEKEVDDEAEPRSDREQSEISLDIDL